MSDLDPIASELLALPLDEFTAARNRRASELKASGNKDLAAAVQALRRPSLALWAANQLAGEGDLLQTVQKATAAAVAAQSGTSAATLRSAASEMQRALDGASRAVGELLRASGHAASDAAVLRARELIRVAAVDGGESWERLVSGALTNEPDAPSNVTAFAGPVGSESAQVAPARTAQAARASSELRLAREQARADAKAAAQARALAERLRGEADRLAEQAKYAASQAAEADVAATRAQEQATESARAAEALASG